MAVSVSVTYLIWLLESCKVTGRERRLHGAKFFFVFQEGREDQEWLWCNNYDLTAKQRGVNHLFYPQNNATHHTRCWARVHARKHRHLLLCDGETGVVRRAITAIHSKDDLPCPSPSPPLWRRSGLSLLWPLMKFQRRDPLGLRVLLHLLPLRTYREIALGISLSPLLCLILWLWDLDLQLLPVHGQALWETFSKYW